MEDGSSLQLVWNRSSSLNELFILKRQLSTVSSFPGYSNGLTFSNSFNSPFIWILNEDEICVLGNVRKKSLYISLLFYGLSVDSTYRRKITGSFEDSICWSYQGISVCILKLSLCFNNILLNNILKYLIIII